MSDIKDNDSGWYNLPQLDLVEENNGVYTNMRTSIAYDKFNIWPRITFSKSNSDNKVSVGFTVLHFYAFIEDLKAVTLSNVPTNREIVFSTLVPPNGERLDTINIVKLENGLIKIIGYNDASKHEIIFDIKQKKQRKFSGNKELSIEDISKNIAMGYIKLLTNSISTAFIKINSIQSKEIINGNKQ